MTQSRKFLVTLLKLVLVSALITYVAFSIQWRDAVNRVDAQGEVVSTTEGRIVGPWDVQVVEFVASPDPSAGVPATDEPRSVRVGVEGPDGIAEQIAPGFLTYLRNLDIPIFLLGALCYLVSLCFSATRWWWLLRVNEVRITPFEALRFTWIGVFFNNVVPGQTGGDVVKALYIMKRAGAGYRVVTLVSVIVDRILGLASLALLGAVVVLFHLDKFPTVALGIWILLGCVALGGIVAFSRRIRRAVGLDALLKRLPLSGLLQRIDSAIMFYRGHKGGMLLWLIAGSLNHAVSVTSFMLVGNALGVGMPPAEYFVLIPVINIVSAVPIAPNGWGIGEALFSNLFGTYGARYLPEGTVNPARVMATRGVALSVLYRVHLTCWSMVGGVLTLFEKDRVTRDDVEHEIAREEPAEVQ